MSKKREFNKYSFVCLACPHNEWIEIEAADYDHAEKLANKKGWKWIDSYEKSGWVCPKCSKK